MKKYFLLLFPAFVFSQQTISTITKDFDTSYSSNTHSIIKINETKTSTIFSPYNYDHGFLYLIDLARKKYEMVIGPSYSTFSPSYIYAHNNKLFFKSDQRLYHYDGESYPYSLLTIFNDEISYVSTDSGLYFVIKNDYNNEYYYYNGASASEIHLPYNANFIHNSIENEIYYSSKDFSNQYNLEAFNKVNHNTRRISSDIVVDQNGYGIEKFQSNLFYAANHENYTLLHQLDTSETDSIVTFESNQISNPIKIDGNFSSIKDINTLLFNGIDENNSNTLFLINSNFEVSKLSNLLHNNIEFKITRNSIKYSTESEIYFTAFNNDESLITIWAFDKNTNAINLIKEDIPLDINNFYVLNEHLIYKDTNTIYGHHIPTNTTLPITENFSEVTYLTFQDDYFYFSANEPVHGNELYRLNPTDFSYELWMDINRHASTNVSQLMKHNDYGYFISDYKMYQFDGNSFIPISEQNESLLPSAIYIEDIKNYKQIEDVNNKLFFRNMNNRLISLDKTNGALTNLGNLLYNTNEFLTRTHFAKANNKIYYFTNSTEGSKINVTDGTTENTQTLAIGGYDNLLLFSPKHLKYNENHNKIYFVSAPPTTSYLNTIDPENDVVSTVAELNITDPIIHLSFGNYLLIEGYNQTTGQHELYLSNGQNLGTRIPVNLGSHTVTGTFVKENLIYFTFNNKFYSYNIETGNANQIFSSNYERLFNLKSCGNSFYFEDEFFKQIFRTTGNTTTLIKKFTEDYKNLDGICNNGVMYYINDDSKDLINYETKRNYIVASTDQQHYEIEIEHEFNDLGSRTYLEFKDFNVINNKILFNYYHPTLGKELLIGDLSNLTLDIKDFPINQQDSNSLIKIYPNPTSDYFNIESEDNVEEIHIYDNLGRLIKIIVSPKNKIDITQLAKGIYYIKLKTTTYTETKKLIKN